MPEQLKPLQVPIKVKYLLRLYSDLAQGRQNGMSANPISATEIKAWLEITGRTLSNWELQTLRAIDRGFVNG